MVSVKRECQGRGAEGHDLVLYPSFSQLWVLCSQKELCSSRNVPVEIIKTGTTESLESFIFSWKQTDLKKRSLCTSLWKHGASQLLWIRALGSSPPLIYWTGSVCLAQHRHSPASWLHIPCYFPFILPLAETSLQRERTNYLFLYWQGSGGKSGGKQLHLPRWLVKILFPSQEYKLHCHLRDGVGCTLLLHCSLQDVPLQDHCKAPLQDWKIGHKAIKTSLMVAWG